MFDSPFKKFPSSVSDILEYRNLKSSINIVTRLQDRRPRDLGPIYSRDKRFLTCSVVQTCSWVYPILHWTGTGGFLSMEVKEPVLEDDLSLLDSARLRKNGSITLFPMW